VGSGVFVAVGMGVKVGVGAEVEVEDAVGAIVGVVVDSGV